MTFVWIIIGVVVGGIIAYLLTRKNQGDSGSFVLLQSQLEELRRTLDDKLGSSSKEMQEASLRQFSESQKFLREFNEQVNKSLLDVTREQTKANEATRQFVTIAEQLSNLEKVLKHQKQRGNLGEASLQLILDNILGAGGSYKMQHKFLNGETVDAVIVTKEGLIPIDAKFSLDNYNRILQAIDDKQKEELEKDFRNDLKKRIDETAKYVRPEEGTLPFAFMFIPAEAIYYDLLINEVGAIKVNTRNLIDYAYNEKKVVIVSPTTFAAYLQSVLYGFKAFKIEESAKDIIKRVGELGKHLAAHEEYMQKLGNSMGTAVNHYNAAYKELGKVDKDVTRIAGSSPGLDPMAIDKPTTQLDT
ncbi:MAG TPA: DNA recombination protein RmuC [Candidatus Paceibacterota bacterium]